MQRAFVRVVPLVLTCLVLTECRNGVIRTYPGAAGPGEQTAALTIRVDTTIVAFDGTPLPRNAERGAELEMLAGNHSISFTTPPLWAVGYPRFSLRGGVHTMWFSAKAGARYELVGGVLQAQILDMFSVSLSEVREGAMALPVVRTTCTGGKTYCCSGTCGSSP